MNNKPIGVFDSGVGGLTAVKELISNLPDEDIIYFGDTGRVPYGSRSTQTIIKYTKQDLAFLKSFDIKIIICACGTASSAALPEIGESEIPVIGVVEPTAIDAVKATRNGKIGILGTMATINSGSYKKAILKLNPDAEVFSKACPLFVPLVENGYFNHRATKIIAEEYLEEFKNKGVDTVILGCTHFPLLKGVISDIMGDKVTLVDAGKSAADYVKNILADKNMLCEHKNSSYSFYTSDSGVDFMATAEMFLNRKIKTIQQIDIEKVKI